MAYEPNITDVDREMVKISIRQKFKAGAERARVRYELVLDLGLESAVVQGDVDAGRYERSPDVHKARILSELNVPTAVGLLDSPEPSDPE